MTMFSVPQISSVITGARSTPAGHVLSRRFAQTVFLWHERARQRRHLQGLSDHMLRDIGLTRADVHAECSKPFWCP